MTQPECNEDYRQLFQRLELFIPYDWNRWPSERKLAYVERMRNLLIDCEQNLAKARPGAYPSQGEVA